MVCEVVNGFTKPNSLFNKIPPIMQGAQKKNVDTLLNFLFKYNPNNFQYLKGFTNVFFCLISSN